MLKCWSMLGVLAALALPSAAFAAPGPPAAPPGGGCARAVVTAAPPGALAVAAHCPMLLPPA